MSIPHCVDVTNISERKNQNEKTVEQTGNTFQLKAVDHSTAFRDLLYNTHSHFQGRLRGRYPRLHIYNSAVSALHLACKRDNQLSVLQEIRA